MTDNYQNKINDNIPVFTNKDFFREGENVYIHMSTEFPDFVGVLHKHKFIEIVYVISGHGTHVAGDKVSSVSKGDLFVINYETPHAFYGSPDGKENFVAYDLMFTNDFFDSSMIGINDFEALGSSFLFYSLFPEEQKFGPVLQLTGNSYNLFGEIFNKIYQEFNGREKGYIEIIRAYVIELILKMFRKIDSPSHSNITHKQLQTVNLAIDYLRNNYDKHITLEQLSARTFLSKDYFSKLFREVTGLPFSVLLQKIRIEHARLLLESTDDIIVDIASRCGFNDIKFFYSSFKKIVGMTPGEYRNKFTNIKVKA